MQIYLVGGAVRDKLLSLPVKDKDFVVVGATPAEMLEQGYQQVGKDFPVFLHPSSKQEYALARTERKSGSGYTGFTCYAAPDVTLEQDLVRRDLTINAMVEDMNGQIIDPLNARADLNNRILRHISESFSEDPLRVLRVARFAARFHHLGFTIANETLTLMQGMTQVGDLAELTPERVWQEVEKTLSAANPEIFFHVLNEIGALAVILPELDALFERMVNTHREGDNGTKTVGQQALIQLQKTALLSADLAIRFAALIQQLDNSQVSIKALAKRCKVPNEHRDLALLVSAQQENIHSALTLEPTDIISLFDNTDAWRKPERFQQILLTCSSSQVCKLPDEYQPTQYLTQMLNTACDIAVQPIIAAGFRGAEIKQQLTTQRIAALATLRSQ
ncbi:CCA-adding enzyme-CCA tRNA nucleotidyltransferase-tRNA CCA-pyrophosphorylase-tRNA adenylyl-/cytidylyl-transferase-tRNA nucleotidyltransferase-tRNA-NT [Moritella viscosa]|uniref:CCA-adding enzyme n=1 Tax=Moritella viscosa TaxID=80854 RepID=A0A090K463_9GAMM|nr:multifunctional CCA addition/repair protein [Moritella viscosa]CED58528.1 multifunctional CCA protein [Moritella viscosa]SGY82761.1 CCA-adding enzyme-CCA tRNA nucleotidyltransferase-tRNA CCA-pyrophosphorylase-tRNA adenylyl-/cytidylyl-transferase-tRNA nucleotidyltransferase-tRNA-NT [Moritella viscosa]SHN96653.1 CCA-adding enzyme-CCA tRNA nucleotidyltransferase-tRNA CCA-pyrophosphorylase-tRNA adenylyl-/cytidylyl-transferase-tRNA nucleotidyltransferase-tRNA-NT [Moritella viscosa]SHN96683.1 CCA-